MSSEKNLSFSSEVAETLGVECAIILNQYNENLLEDITSLDSLIKSTKKNISFLDEEKIKESINTLIKYQLIDINKYKLLAEFTVCGIVLSCLVSASHS